MNESDDLKGLLQRWPYDPENDTRLIRGDDGRELLQVRTVLGIEQFEADGRPDGMRPHDMDSALEYYQQQYDDARKAGRGSDFDLSPEDCSELFHEGTLYYFRYVRFFQLRDWQRTIRDTARNLRAFDFIHAHARREEDREFLEKWRPYILRVNASAAAMFEVERQAYEQGAKVVDEAIANIEGLEDQDDETFKFERDRSLMALRDLSEQILKNRPLSKVEQLEHQLNRAIEKQEFERAAQLRDRIRELKKNEA
jgi:hypothetical protein